MFGREPENRNPTARRLREAYRRRLWEVLGRVEDDLASSEAASALTPTGATEFELDLNAPLEQAQHLFQRAGRGIPDTVLALAVSSNPFK